MANGIKLYFIYSFNCINNEDTHTNEQKKVKSMVGNVKNKRKVRKILYILFIIIYSISSFVLVTFMPVFQLPKPTGPFEVGMNSRHLKDESRQNSAQKFGN